MGLLSLLLALAAMVSLRFEEIAAAEAKERHRANGGDKSGGGKSALAGQSRQARDDAAEALGIRSRGWARG